MSTLRRLDYFQPIHINIILQISNHFEFEVTAYHKTMSRFGTQSPGGVIGMDFGIPSCAVFSNIGHEEHRRWSNQLILRSSGVN